MASTDQIRTDAGSRPACSALRRTMPTARRADELRPRKQPRQRRSRDTVAAVLEAAAQVFTTRGYAATTTNHIAQRAGAHGFTFGDVRPTFTGHEICSGSSWLHSVDWFNIGNSYHPTAAGQSGGYLPVLDAAA